MVRHSEAIQYYSKPGIAEELVRISQDREVVVNFQDKFGKRPNMLQFPAEVREGARSGATSFHISEERWKDPMQLRLDMNKKDMNDLRIAWDFIIDIDCPWFEYSTISASLLLEALKQHGIRCASIKFSGNRGWHIGIPFEAFPKKVGRRDSSKLFPDITVQLISYLKQYVEDALRDRIIEFEGGDVKNILKRTGKKKEDFIKEGKLYIYTLVDLDIALGAPRHLIRAPYSLHEKTGLVSLVISSERLNFFKKEMAKPENIEEIDDSFLNPKKCGEGEASQLLMQALDWEIREKKKDEKAEFEPFEGKVGKDKFPPCILNILKGLEDGRKRSLFVLVNFLKTVGWGWKDIENEVREWNEKNSPPLRAGYLNSQLKWHKRQTEKFPPPNCADANYYRDVGICKPDRSCEKIKNPLTYVKRRLRKGA